MVRPEVSENNVTAAKKISVCQQVQIENVENEI